MGGEIKWGDLEHVAGLIGVEDFEALADGLLVVSAHVSEMRAKEQNRK